MKKHGANNASLLGFTHDRSTTLNPSSSYWLTCHPRVCVSSQNQRLLGSESSCSCWIIPQTFFDPWRDILELLSSSANSSMGIFAWSIISIARVSRHKNSLIHFIPSLIDFICLKIWYFHGIFQAQIATSSLELQSFPTNMTTFHPGNHAAGRWRFKGSADSQTLGAVVQILGKDGNFEVTQLDQPNLLPVPVQGREDKRIEITWAFGPLKVHFPNFLASGGKTLLPHLWFFDWPTKK